MIDAVASEGHYLAHLAPVWDALSVRGELNPAEPTSALALVASHADIVRGRRLGYRSFAFIEHGIGQSYGGRRRVANPSYAGGPDRRDVGLFLVPNERCAADWRTAYPAARVEVVGSPRIDGLPRRDPDHLDEAVVAVSFHWDGSVVSPEAGNAFSDFRLALPALAERFTLIGHAHPKAPWPRQLERAYARLGIEFVSSFDDVCRRSSVYVCDNSSTIYEFASTGRPVVVMNARQYRKDVHHGLRFWEAADVGVQVDDPADLVAAVGEAITDPPARRAAREAALDVVYQPRHGGARLAAAAVADWAAASRQTVAA